MLLIIEGIYSSFFNMLSLVMNFLKVLNNSWSKFPYEFKLVEFCNILNKILYNLSIKAFFSLMVIS